MSLGTWARRGGFLLMVLVLGTTACSATESVTINQDAIASATSIAVRNDASSGAQESVETDPEPEAPTAVAAPADDATEPAATDDDDPEPTESSTLDPINGCLFSSIDSFGDIQIRLAFTSELTEQEDASATYEVYDGNGELLVESTHFFEELAPGEQVRIAVDTLTEEPTDRGARSGITCALIAVEPTPVGFESFAPGPSDSCRFVEIDGFGDIQIELSVVSPLTTSSELAVDYALRGPNGIRFADGVNFTVEVGPGETSITPTDTFAGLPEWVTESDFSCEILSVQGF